MKIIDVFVMFLINKIIMWKYEVVKMSLKGMTFISNLDGHIIQHTISSDKVIIENTIYYGKFQFYGKRYKLKNVCILFPEEDGGNISEAENFFKESKKFVKIARDFRFHTGVKHLTIRRSVLYVYIVKQKYRK